MNHTPTYFLLSKMLPQFIIVNEQNNGNIIVLQEDDPFMGYRMYLFFWYCDCYKDSNGRYMTFHYEGLPIKTLMKDYCPCNNCKTLSI